MLTCQEFHAWEELLRSMEMFQWLGGRPYRFRFRGTNVPEDIVGSALLLGYVPLCGMVNPQSPIVCDELLPLCEIVVHVLGNGERRDSPHASSAPSAAII